MTVRKKIVGFSVFYAVIFTVLAGVLIWTAVQYGGAAWILLWPALSFLMVAVAYEGVGPVVFGKRADGTRKVWAMIGLFPYLAILWLIWMVRRLIVRKPCGTEIVPGLWLGRRPYVHELPPQTTCVVDLACEFPAAVGVKESCDYISLPTLDTLVPEEADFIEAVRQVVVHSGVVYVHCALGHGRSAMFVATVMLARRVAKTPAEVLQMIQNVRPSIRLSRRQMNFLENFSK